MIDTLDKKKENENLKERFPGEFASLQSIIGYDTDLTGQ